MKFKNTSNKIINLKLEKEWKTIKPDEFIDLSAHIANKETGLEHIKEEPIKSLKPKNIVLKPKLKTEKELKQMTKDEINDYSAKLGFDEVNCSMLKSEMIKKVLKLKKTQGY